MSCLIGPPHRLPPHRQIVRYHAPMTAMGHRRECRPRRWPAWHDPMYLNKRTRAGPSGWGQRRAMCGRLRAGKVFFTRAANWSEQPCVRPVSAVHVTASHNALRGSGPDQIHAFNDALTEKGCLDRRIDRLCMTCCSPSQPFASRRMLPT